MRTLTLLAIPTALAVIFGAVTFGCAQLSALQPKVENAARHSQAVLDCANMLGTAIARSGKEPPLGAVMGLCVAVEEAPPLGASEGTR